MLEQKPISRKWIIFGCAAVMAALDIPFRALEFLGLMQAAGPKNVLPVLFGLLFGPAGAIGSALGAFISGVCRLSFGLDVWAEALAVFCAALIAWFGWYAFGWTEPPRMKRLSAVIRYICVSAVAGAVNGIICAVLLCRTTHIPWFEIYVEVQLSALAWALLLGLPMLITATSMFAMLPVMPKHLEETYHQTHQPPFDHTIPNDIDEVAKISDAIDMFNMEYGISIKRAYSIMSCVEELNLKIMEQLPPDATIRITIEAGDNVVIRLFYGGKRFDPMAIRTVRGDPTANLDAVGILLVREMAVLTGFWYVDGVNQVKIIL